MKIALVGDVMLGRLVNDFLQQAKPEYPWGNTLTILQQAHLRICNLECVISDFGTPWSATSKAFHFRTDEKNIESLKTAGIDIVSIANNHVLDFEHKALNRMVNVLDDHHVLHSGAGYNIDEASKPVISKVNEQKIGFIAFSDNEPDWEAQTDIPGIFYVPTDLKDHRAIRLFELVRDLKNHTDFVIVSAHWGSNWGYNPPHVHIRFAHALVDAGADLVFGHSCHVFRGIEIYKKRPIIYSAGDFIDDYAVDEVEKNDESFIFLLEIDQKSKLRLYPTHIRHFQANLAAHPLKNEILQKMKNLCKGLGTSLQCYQDHAWIDL